MLWKMRTGYPFIYKITSRNWPNSVDQIVAFSPMLTFLTTERKIHKTVQIDGQTRFFGATHDLFHSFSLSIQKGAI